jgi:hypothetical protein
MEIFTENQAAKIEKLTEEYSAFQASRNNHIDNLVVKLLTLWQKTGIDDADILIRILREAGAYEDFSGTTVADNSRIEYEATQIFYGVIIKLMDNER